MSNNNIPGPRSRFWAIWPPVTMDYCTNWNGVKGPFAAATNEDTRGDTAEWNSALRLPDGIEPQPSVGNDLRERQGFQVG